MIISICGKSGSGKSTLAELIVKEFKNAVHLDIDTISHNVLLIPEVKKELVNTFGTVVLVGNPKEDALLSKNNYIITEK